MYPSLEPMQGILDGMHTSTRQKDGHLFLPPFFSLKRKKGSTAYHTTVSSASLSVRTLTSSGT